MPVGDADMEMDNRELCLVLRAFIRREGVGALGDGVERSWAAGGE